MQAVAQQVALEQAVTEIERHVNGTGWDQPAQLFALVPTTELLAAEPGLAEQLGVEDARQELTPVAQGELPAGDGVTAALAGIEWPDGVRGCALAVEQVMLPEGAEEIPAQHAREHEVRMVAGVLRGGERYGVVRLRSHDDDAAVLTGRDLTPTLCDVLALTFELSGEPRRSVGHEEETEA
jgi:hypothetical protein